ncbi:MAG: hypothetical protein NZ108_08970 [Bacteroidia bacterium]|nr:hypothetical protein [Bacteroidia bacterium]
MNVLIYFLICLIGISSSLYAQDYTVLQSNSLRIILPAGVYYQEGQQPIVVRETHGTVWKLFLEIDGVWLREISIFHSNKQANESSIYPIWEDEYFYSNIQNELPILRKLWIERNYSDEWQFVETANGLWLYRCGFEPNSPGFLHQFISFHNNNAISIQFISSQLFEPDYKNCENGLVFYQTVLEKIKIQP